MSKARKWVFSTVIFVIAIAFGLVVAVSSAHLTYALQSARSELASGKLHSADDLSAAFEAVAETIKPSVVNISSIKRVHVADSQMELFSNSPFRDFFGDDFFGQFFNQHPQGDYVQQGLGTGVIISDDGYILTNNHVVDDADEVKVKLSDERSFTGKIVGTDPKTDIAVIKIDATGLQPAVLGDSDALRIGEWVVAVGNPFGLSSTITAGIVSATGRANVGISDYEDFIQTDAAINPGNSGGPLLNLHGEVIGINTAIFSRSGGYMGIGFAIPIQMAKSIMGSLIDEGRVVRGWLGLTIQNLDAELASSFGYEGSGGVLVSDVTPDGPCDKAGVVSGDIIVGYAGQDVQNMEKFRSRVAATHPGTTIELKVFRDGKVKTLSVQVAELEADAQVAAGASSKERLGMTLRTLTPDLARRLGYPDDQSGVVVIEVNPLGPAAAAGIRSRDVIVSVQNETVDSVGSFHAAMQKVDLKDGVRMGVLSSGLKHFVFVKTGD